MKKAVSSFLAASALLVAPGVLPHFASAFAQAATPAAGGQVQMDPAEYTDYDNAVNKQTTPATQAPALEAYLAKYPKSSVKADVLQRLMVDYSQIPDAGKAISTADQILQLDPNNLTADIVETVFRAQQGKLDDAATYAQKGLATTKPDAVKQEDFDKQKNGAIPTFQSTIGNAALAKKDYPTAITAFKAELAAVPVAATQTVGVPLQDTYNLGQAYYASTPPDYVNCTFYTTRAAQFAPDPYKTQFQQLAAYCYKKYHGGADGYDAVTAAAKANLNPPSDFTIKPAPTPADQAAALLASTKDEDLPKLALTDKEFVLQYAKPEDADKLFATVKEKGEKITDATVITGSTADKLLLAVSDDAVQAKTADITLTMKTPLKAVPADLSKITVIGVWTSYTQSPFMITMTDGEKVGAPAPAKKATAPARRRK
jgi:tetratricopeptide (TPR) repeat protein